ncbi:pirin family protein [Taylorella equigenitalis]|nr:pirin family protein [Taylorella equigenitalis]AFN36027.1 pirin-like protein [Taylorella equigenitalis ATCC 35865]ASY37966.1 pirin family protein [Taylorella equigenitalis]ASY39440.1 pirin family protein [Taylorella equigenitalis]ASY40953.1 hypothetical protein CAV20_04585 [Taylorella equigenitalis]KGK32985.1 pirin [Taylorella equigenitalis]
MTCTVTNMQTGFATKDGAGVSLIRVLGHDTVETFDPILMLDSFDSSNPDDYTAGFPMHPHRGIETISYVFSGGMQHRDNLGYEDTVSNGEVQWMTAGSGILHEEKIPEADHLLGVQLWLNMPASDKMKDPEYHPIKNPDIKKIDLDGAQLRLLAGRFPLTDIDSSKETNLESSSGFISKYTPFNYYDVSMQSGAVVDIPVPPNSSVMIFTLLGAVKVCDTLVAPKTAAKISGDGLLKLEATEGENKVLVMISKALKEPVAWGGPIVMNTREELDHAFQELRSGTFIKSKMVVDT